ncbi:MAG TPA: hypothetical protein VFU88_21110 [Ktedonobacterales bacterium]|nr:hypothetical protein [Ktedonobacterales bacterium]
MSNSASALDLPDGLVAVVKQDCPTCQLVAPVLGQLQQSGILCAIYTQDDPVFPPGLQARDDTALEVSYRLGVEIVPTLARIEAGRVVERAIGWSRAEWEALTGVADLGPDLPAYRPGCGSISVEPGIAEELAVRFGGERLRARRVELAALEDETEAAFERGWTDGLPVVPPTPGRVLRMLEGTTLPPDEVVAVVPPDLVPCSVEKVAINAVMAGCRPEYLPVVIAAVRAACTDAFNIHGVLATTYAVGPVVIVNGPIARALGMNAGMNAFGQGNRANATIGRAVQLVIRNVGGGRPGEIDRAVLGNPGKYTFCFAEDEAGSPWESLAVERGIPPGASAVTLFAGEGPRMVVDQISRTPESLAHSLAWCLRSVAHPKLAQVWDAFLVVTPSHARIFREAGWSKQRLRDELAALMTLPAAELARSADGCAEGMPALPEGGALTKFRPGGLGIVHAGGAAGLFSSIIGGWTGGPGGSQPVTQEIVP